MRGLSYNLSKAKPSIYTLVRSKDILSHVCSAARRVSGPGLDVVT